MNNRLIVILVAISLTLSCGMFENDSDEGATGLTALESGDEASEDKEKEACVSFSATCPDHCYTGKVGVMNEEKDCFEIMEAICSDTPRGPDGLNANVGRLHVPSGNLIATPFLWEEFYTDEWKAQSGVGGDDRLCNELL